MYKTNLPKNFFSCSIFSVCVCVRVLSSFRASQLLCLREFSRELFSLSLSSSLCSYFIQHTPTLSIYLSCSLGILKSPYSYIHSHINIRGALGLSIDLSLQMLLLGNLNDVTAFKQLLPDAGCSFSIFNIVPLNFF